MSSHWIHQPGVARLERWNVPRSHRFFWMSTDYEFEFDVGEFALDGASDRHDCFPSENHRSGPIFRHQTSPRWGWLGCSDLPGAVVEFAGRDDLGLNRIRFGGVGRDLLRSDVRPPSVEHRSSQRNWTRKPAGSAT